MKHLYALVSLLLLLSGSTLVKAQEPLIDRILIEFMKPGDPDAKARDYNLLPWPEEAKAAAYKAAEIWASYLEITVPIRVKFGWCDNIEANAMGGSSFTSKYDDGYFYPYSLLDQLSGRDVNPNVVDIICVFKSHLNIGWYFGTDGEIGLTPDPNDPGIQYFQKDLLTTMLHEICHGLGINGGTMEVNKGVGSWGGTSSKKANIFDSFICDNVGNQLIDERYFKNNSKELADILTSDNIFWMGNNASHANNNIKVQIYAPNQWSSSSICHIDGIYAKTENRLMSGIGIEGGEHQHRPGPIVLGMLQDIGWTLKSGSTANVNIHMESPIKIHTSGNDIIIEGAGNNDKVLVFDFTGRLRYTSNGSGRISLKSGLYIVRVGNISYKIRL